MTSNYSRQQYYSRLQKKQEKMTKTQAYLLFAGSIVLIVVMVVFGLPALFNLSSTILGLKGGATPPADEQILPPDAPKLSPDYEATNSAQIKVRGVADSNLTVELFQNDNSLGTQESEENGNFSFEVTLEKGDNTFEAQVISDKGKRSSKSAPYVVRFLTSEPKLESDNLKDGDQVSDSSLTVNGKTDPGNTITINDYLVIVKSDGSFSHFLNLNEGDNKLKIVASDQAGNKTTKELTVKYVRP